MDKEYIKIIEKIKNTVVTPDQQLKLNEYARTAINIALQTQDKPITEKEKLKIFDLINDYRMKMGMEKAEKFLWFDSPFAAKAQFPELTYQNACLGQYDISLLQYYWFYREVLGFVEETDLLKPLYELTKLVGWFWVSDNQLPYKNYIIATSRPRFISYHQKANGEKTIHNFNDYAIKYWDNNGVYVLNDIYLDDLTEGWIIKTPADKLKLKDILVIKNTELRSQALRKINLENCFNDFEDKKLLGKKDEYELWELDFITNNRIYLKMVCPSSGKIAIEAVHPDCRTLDSALIWRQTQTIDLINKYKRPIIET